MHLALEVSEVLVILLLSHAARFFLEARNRKLLRLYEAALKAETHFPE